ncbi:MAG TPA: Trk system potassium transporter TrkA [bacterium]|nr:Trk system potassium transporter TrkA [bacterium]
MKVVIVGGGTVGFDTARQLIVEKKDVVLVERDAERAKYLSSHLDCMVLAADGTDPDTLRQAGDGDVAYFIAVTDSDEVNLVCCGIAASVFEKAKSIARVRNLSYAKATLRGKTFLGADFVITPEVEAARQILDAVTRGAVSDVLRFEGTDIQVWNAPVDRKSPFRNRKLSQLRKEISDPFLVAGMLHDGEMIIPTGNTVIKENDRIYLAGNGETLQRLFAKTGRRQTRIEKILLIGVGKVGGYVAKYLGRRGLSLTIVDSNYEKCKKLSTEYPDALVLCGDIADESLLQDERLDRYDLVIATTGDQELNILSAVYARSLGVRHAIVLIDSINYLRVASKLDIDSTVSPKSSSVDAILRILRKGTVKTMYSIFDGTAEVLEYVIDAASSLSGKAIMHAGLPADTLIVAVIRDGKDIMPHGGFSLQAGDTIIVITKRAAIPQVERLFSGAQ